MEEDIKILEERVTTLKRHIKNYEESDCKTNIYQQLVKECNALENLIKRYKELEEENKLLTEKADTYYELYWEKCIPISVIQNKIGEYREENRKLYNEEGIIVNERMVKNKLRAEVLQELLEERNK